jgi:hypothetical protein
VWDHHVFFPFKMLPGHPLKSVTFASKAPQGAVHRPVALDSWADDFTKKSGESMAFMADE